jgi:Peptidase family M28
VGKDDGAKIQGAIAAGRPARATMNVSASLRPAQGRNVLAYLPGTDPSGAYVMVGAHYDTWATGSSDNGTGVAAMLEMADRLGSALQRRLGVLFVGFDAEELGLFGAYDFLRKHIIVDNEPMLGFINLETPADGPPGGLRAIASTNGSPIAPAASEVGLNQLYPLAAGLDQVPSLFGGLIPADVQGMYWHGLQGMTTYCDSDYYHTVEDTPDKVDTEFLARVSLALYDALGALDDEPVQSFQVRDEKVWNPTVSTAPAADGGLDVAVSALDVDGLPQPGAQIRVWVNVDDFTRVFEETVTADEAGKAAVQVPAAALGEGKGGRWLHMTAGRAYPLSERMIPLP